MTVIYAMEHSTIYDTGVGNQVSDSLYFLAIGVINSTEPDRRCGMLSDILREELIYEDYENIRLG